MATLVSSNPNWQVQRHAPLVVGLVADDVTTRRLEAALRQSCRIVARAQTIDQLLDGETVPFDLVVLAGGGELLARGGPVEVLKTLRPACSTVVVATTEDPGLIRKALRCGADGFVFHSAAATALAPAVEAVRVGHLSVPVVIRRRARWSQFSVRERQVLQLVADGLTNSEIADRLFLSESTVKCHLSSGFRKLGVTSRAEAAAAVLDPETGLHVRAA
ncbi:MAG: LuxR C-terminal-related transcriptional regulator [Solirubrobacteraceae bacterium]